LKKNFQSILLLLIILSLAIPSATGQAKARAQANVNEVAAHDLLVEMTAAERVGQVFLVSFQGSSAQEGSRILSLIEDKHIGGVVLRKDNDNFTGPENTVGALKELVTDLQTAAQLANNQGSYTPLLVAITPNADFDSEGQILHGVTNLPNQMTIGASWEPTQARAAGTLLGTELEALGINMLIGPSLDVLDITHTEGRDDLGVMTFGGNSYWVGKLGKAYIEGVQAGSANRMAVIATHFPGSGSSDRQPDEEIATVRKSLEQLINVELAPFFKVTNIEQGQSGVVDGLLLSHIRYQGVQGTIQPSTKPISFDPVAVDQIMNMPEMSPWRATGGLIVSDDLGSESIRKFVDPLNTGFDARQVARTALMAGNDLLYMGNILATGDEDNFTTVVRTIDYFIQKYEEDSAFRTRVDDAVLKILQLKMKIYPAFNPADVLSSHNRIDAVGQGQATVMDIAQSAVTLLSPEVEDLNSLIPDPPGTNDRIVIISEERTIAQCSNCPNETDFPAVNLMNSLIRLYGSGAGDPILGNHLTAYSYENLRMILEQADGTEEILVSLNAATWIIFTFAEFGTDKVEAQTYKRLFDERPDLVRNKKLIGLAFNAPYFLDSTDISKLTAYYALYSNTPEFYDIASRVLMQELTPSGKLPVSVPGIGYDLVDVISPDPDQMIPLVIESPVELKEPQEPPLAGYSQPLLYKAGDTIPIKAGVIIDNNGNPVPDGTLVRFIIDTRSTSGSVEQLEARTVDGFARVMYVIPSIGSLQLSVSADPAFISQILRLDITDTGGVVTSFEPTAIPEGAELTTPTDVPPTPTPESKAVQLHKQGKVAFSDWLIANILIIIFCLGLSYFTHIYLSTKWNYLTILFTGTGGYLGYLWAALGLPGSKSPLDEIASEQVLLIVGIGLVCGLGLGLLFYWWKTRKQRSAQERNQQG